jgi:hypothetical protein
MVFDSVMPTKANTESDSTTPFYVWGGMTNDNVLIQSSDYTLKANVPAECTSSSYPFIQTLSSGWEGIKHRVFTEKVQAVDTNGNPHSPVQFTEIEALRWSSQMRDDLGRRDNSELVVVLRSDLKTSGGSSHFLVKMSGSTLNAISVYRIQLDRVSASESHGTIRQHLTLFLSVGQVWMAPY